MKFPETISQIKNVLQIYPDSSLKIVLYSDEYSREDILKLADELRTSGIKWEKLLRVRRPPERKEEEETLYPNELLMIKSIKG